MNEPAEMMSDDGYAAQEEAEQRKTRLALLAATLEKEALTRVAARANIERRWVEDVYQYNGEYDPETKAKLDSNDAASKVFVNITRPKTNTVEARLVDMLFPTDDKNWGIQPTPMPNVSASLSNTDMLPGSQSMTVGAAAQLVLTKAKDRAEAMEREIDDQFKECNYNIKCRDVIHEAMVLGTGVLKGPIVVDKAKRRWNKVGRATNGTDVYQLQHAQDLRPTVEFVSVWDVFPDMTSPIPADGEGIFERHFLSPRRVRSLLNNPGFEENAIRALLMEQPNAKRSDTDRQAQMRALAGLNGPTYDNHYEVWEYTGPISRADAEACGLLDAGDDPLDMIDMVIWFCGAHILKAVLYPLESAEFPYSFFYLQRDDSSPFGFGVPYELRSSQRIVNAAWRMIVENGALSIGPQIVINKNAVTPADGDYKLRGRKVWYLNSTTAKLNDAFGTFDIPSRLNELERILLTTMRLADEESSTPIIAQGDMAQHVPDTVGGMTMLMNNANALTRRIVKNFDDDLTVPTVTRFFDWNMQFSSKNEIKGDSEVVARGTSALLVREQQQQALMQFMAVTSNPLYAPLTKPLGTLRAAARAMHLDADEHVKTDDEVRQEQESQQGQQSPEMMRLQMEYQMHQEKLADNEKERQQRAWEREMEFKTKAMDIMSREHISMAQLQAGLEEVMMDTQVKRRNFVDETKVKLATGQGI